MTLFILNLRISVISMALQKLEPRAIYLRGPDSSDLKALLKKNHFCKLRFFLDGLFPIAQSQIILSQIF